MKREEIVSLTSALRFLVRGEDGGQRVRLAVILAVVGLCLAAVTLDVVALVVW